MIKFLLRATVICQAACIGAAYGLGRLGNLLLAIHVASTGGLDDATTTTADRPVTYAKSQAN